MLTARLVPLSLSLYCTELPPLENRCCGQVSELGVGNHGLVEALCTLGFSFPASTDSGGLFNKYSRVGLEHSST